MKNVRIVFERLANPDVTSYEVLSSPPNTRLQERVFVIDNPKDVNPVMVKAEFTKNDNVNTDKYTQIFQLKHNTIMIDGTKLLTVYLNGQEFDRELVYINNKAKCLFVYYELEEGDVITVEYYIDGVEFEFQTQYDDYVYNVKAIVDGHNSLVGKHNILV